MLYGIVLTVVSLYFYKLSIHICCILLHIMFVFLSLSQWYCQHTISLSGSLLILLDLFLSICFFVCVTSGLLVSFLHVFALLNVVSWFVCTWLFEVYSAFYIMFAFLFLVFKHVFIAWCVYFCCSLYFVHILCKCHFCICIGHTVFTFGAGCIVLLILMSHLHDLKSFSLPCIFCRIWHCDQCCHAL